MKTITRGASALLLAIAITPASGARAELPGNSAEGKRLLEANCSGCHDTGVFTRKDRSVRSLDELRKQLENCSHMAGKHFSTIETENLIKYLNDTFYRFH